MKKFTFSLPQQSKYFEVEANNKEEAKDILENCENLTEYEIEDMEIWQPNFEFID